jgi:phage-related protein
VFFVLDLIEQIERVPREYFKKLQGTDDIWEVRIQHGNNIFRILGFWDGNDIVVLNHAFTKKTQKVPRKEINVAEQRKHDYLKRKRKP